MKEEVIKNLIEKAFEARENAYAPYSRFKVGAALLGKNGKVYTGVNVENSSYPAGICGERAAMVTAVSDGTREFDAIAIVGAHEELEDFDYCPPCGICRQVMAEFCPPDGFLVILAKSPEEYKLYTLGELLPTSFGREHLGSTDI